jgi:hypothetical protein
MPISPPLVHHRRKRSLPAEVAALLAVRLAPELAWAAEATAEAWEVEWPAVVMVVAEAETEQTASTGILKQEEPAMQEGAAGITTSVPQMQC